MPKGEFFQQGPEVLNQYRNDQLLQSTLSQRLPGDIFRAAQPELDRMGERAATDLLRASALAEAEVPVHVPFDPWGRRIDEIRMSPAWQFLAGAAAEEGIVATGYERKFGAYSRLVQFAKLYLFHPSSAFVTCPLAMSDGAARALELYGDEELKNGPFRRLISRDARDYWTSGQWMTEKTGGSDVGGTQTVARPLAGHVPGATPKDGWYELSGVKWFTSATTSQMAMALARIEGHADGARGLSLFYIPVRDASGRLQNIEILRLKDKLGTRAMPTAELELRGCPAKLVGGELGGVKKISSLFNITRMYNAVCALGGARRALVLALDYAHNRQAFGRRLAEHPLHAETLAELVVELEGCFVLTFHLAELLGRDELGQASPEESAMLRMLTPIAKLYTGKAAMAITSEALECIGGAAYIEDTGMPALHRNAQVFSIWEGTTNVLSLDVVRAIEKEGAFRPFVEGILKRVTAVKGFDAESAAVKARCAELTGFLQEAVNEGPDCVQASARKFAFALARTCVASLLLEKAASAGDPRSTRVARRWCSRYTDLGLPAAGGSAGFRKGSRELI